MTQPEAPEGFRLIRPRPGFTEAFGPVYLNRQAQKLRFRVSPQHLNPAGFCHGGAMATFADMQIVAVVDEDGGWPLIHRPTVSLAIDYLGPAPASAWVEARVDCLKQTRTLIFTQALLSVAGEPVARTHGVYRNFSVRPLAQR